MQCTAVMQLFHEPSDRKNLDASASHDPQLIDSVSLCILATWIARRDGLDPELGAPVDRAFLVTHSRE